MNKFLILLSCISFGFVNAQDSLNVKQNIEQKVVQNDSVIVEGSDAVKVSNKEIYGEILENSNVSIKNTIDGVSHTKNDISAEVIDSSNVYVDDKLAAEFEAKWREELYNNNLFDTIYRDVTSLKYKAVYYPELPTDTLKARLKRLQARTPFNVEYNPQLESVIKNWLKNRHQSLERLMGMSNYYFPMFEQEFDNLDIPLEMKYLAIVESALKPRARSRVGATGLWQFMYPTGKQYGLEVSSYVDERSDPVKSTKTAGVYLTRLYKIFGDWDLALAAYNSGPGNVNKAIRRSGGQRNYWNLRSFLPRETAGYVPAFLATMYIFEYAKEHGFVQHRQKYRYVETDTIQIKHTVTFDQVSEFTGVNVEEIQYLNPSYKLDIIPFIASKKYALRLPTEALGVLVNNEIAFYDLVKAEESKREKPLPQLVKIDSKVRYRVKSGDYLGKIARKYGVRVSQIKRWNGLRNNSLKIGQRLTINSRSIPKTKISKTKKTKTSSSKKFSGKTHKVHSGDSLWSISQKYSGVSVQNLKEWNNISSTKLKLGQVLKVSK